MAVRSILMGFFCALASAAMGQTNVEALDALSMEVGGYAEADAERDAALQNLYVSLGAHLDVPEDGDDAAGDLDTLMRAVAILRRGSGDIAGAVDALRTAIDTYPPEPPSPPDPPADIRATATALNDTITRFGSEELPHSALDALSMLADTIADLEARRSIYAATAWANRLNSLLAPNEEGEAQVQAEAEAEAQAAAQMALIELSALRATLMTLEEPYYRLAMMRRVADLQAMFGIGAEGQQPLTAADLRALGELQTAISNRLGMDRLTGIHVISAEFGHVGGDRSGGRCNVAPAFREACQRGGRCTLTDELFAGLCGGEDPAPFERSSERGVLIHYNCLRATQAQWNGIMAHPDRAYAQPVLSATLRSPADNIICEPSTPMGTGGETNETN